jgi:ProP effector
MNEVAPSPPRRQQDPALAILTTSFKAFGECLPLAVGIHKIIKERLPDLDPQQIRAALRSHTASTRYLKALSQSKFRFDLDGMPLGEVTEEQRRHAMDALKERFRKQAARQKAEQLVKQQQEKLRLLAEKFNSR